MPKVLKGKKTSTKKLVKESADIVRFITAISAKNYALAHKYLTGIVNEKIKRRINKASSTPLF